MLLSTSHGVLVCVVVLHLSVGPSEY
uniref:Uncharacterized protein n=1 Tax=Rhizophora mucronata TaxID=61149 RepID=A0A2P2QK82_RHIMU